MGRRRKRVRRDIYSSNIQRLSVYPSAARHGAPDPRAGKPPSPGDVVSVRIVSLDEDGRGIGYYRGFKVLVDDVEPGINLKVKIVSVEEDAIRAVPL
ncbi:MAG: hypothetical protein GSR80_000173 [Desulfurococcales archaeon]|nr:hypothetical protein [Desulfurococcales archaeon]